MTVSVRLTGAAELKARLKAIRQFFKPWGRTWDDEVVRIVKPRMPIGKGVQKGTNAHQAGRLRASVRRVEASSKRARVGAHYTQYFIDAGTKAHFEPKHPYFSKRQHPRTRARPFRTYAAHEALRRKPMSEELIRQWNAAGGRIALRGSAIARGDQ